ncbi:hypothetical protein N0V86_009874 [Didymella sp. IMI 355093]|nr:hypothetical protein N0V86_009874 [Didymella sp. IMI 355093]
MAATNISLEAVKPSSSKATLQWTPATTIIDMPNELLRDIFFAIDGEFSKTLYSLELTCKRFCAIVEEHCEPEYNLRGKLIEDPYELMERIKAQPRLRTLIRVARMEYNYASFAQYTADEVATLVTSLGLDWYGDKMKDLWEYSLGKDNGGPLWLCLLLARIETIELSTRMTTLRIVHIPLVRLLQDRHCYDYLQTRQFEDLRNLTLAYPGPRSCEYHDPGKDICVSNLMFPKLRTARLSGCMVDGEGWPDGSEKVDGTLNRMSEYCPGQTSLKGFSNLKSLALTDMSLMGVSRTSGPTHWQQPIEATLQHLADMFPPTLEAFTHLIWDGAAPFDKALTKRQKALRSWNRIWKSASKEQFPSLKKVMVQKYGLYGLSKEIEVIWEKTQNSKSRTR